MKFIKCAFGEFDKMSYEMTMSIIIIFCLSYDLSKVFIAFKVDIISKKNALLPRTLLLNPTESVNTHVIIILFMT